MLFFIMGFDLLMLLTIAVYTYFDEEEGAKGAFVFFFILAAVHVYAITLLATM